MKWLIVLFACLFLLLQYQLWVGDSSLAEVSALKKQLKQQQIENEKLDARNRALAAKVRDLKQGLDAIEEYARDELGMIKEGETFYQIIQKQPSESTISELEPPHSPTPNSP